MKQLISVMGILGMSVSIACAQDMSTNQVSSQMPPLPLNDFAHSLSAGLMVGEPTGPTVKYFLTDVLAVDGAFGWSPFPHADMEFHADILYHDFNLIHVDEGRLPVYVGAGAFVRFRHNADNQGGIRIPFGISYMFQDIPVDIFAEVGPAIVLTPDVRGEIVGGIGARYRF
ncbi:MAG TPA: hypothetical protein VGN23_05125 [Verrucomicrobiae bacterium]|jgi:hypothetical protein